MVKATGFDQDELMARVRSRMEAQGLTRKHAAALIGIGVATLADHLKGEHVRSDSARKYEDWLSGRTSVSNVFALPTSERQPEVDIRQDTALYPPDRPRLVVDIFSGCGGLSLGFDLLDGGSQFRTILAVDNQAAPIAVLNRNAAALGHGDHPVGRVADLTDFLNGAEFLAFYMDHAAGALDDCELRRDLDGLCDRALPLFLDRVSIIDREFVDGLNAIRATRDWKAACDGLDRRAMNQTSVIHFHDRLRLPRPSLKVASLPPLLWSAPAAERGATRRKRVLPDDEWLSEARAEWAEQVAAFGERGNAPARGQLSSSSRRLDSFGAFLAQPVMAQVRDAWIEWRARRLQARGSLFCDQDFTSALQTLYERRAQVSVLVGGPPCQGFSRIGRGKIRSLQEARIHAQSDPQTGDTRNRLFEQYVVVLGALRPDIFLFENVSHFRSVVKVGEQAFSAADVLAEAIDRVSEGEARYSVATETIDASRHGVPQTRQRYFMAGIREARDVPASGKHASTCLQLRRAPEAPLSLALAGLPAPSIVGGDLRADAAMNVKHTIGAMPEERHPYAEWTRQPQPGTILPPATVDGHAYRAPRSDDAAFFGLMGPGKRWMDYRSDLSPTLTALAETLDALLALPGNAVAQLASAEIGDGPPLPSRATLEALRERLDGALPLRLLLEQIGERLGAQHHLLGQNYMAKREGNHGDWVARMDATRPAKTMVSHMGKDTYAYVHPHSPRTISVREAARIQSFPDWFAFGGSALTDAYKMIGNAVPPMLSWHIADKVARALYRRENSATVHAIKR
ncbi:DNA cytosine methyltransferase [Methylorubrum thiocyanatum]|uniref:DNA cytosine methyltransferase n=1 Tax=Methylorubrum thiocyanatum TaxID=47958 RepID=UPI003658EB36